MTEHALEGLRRRAVELRRAGRSRRQIAEELGVTSNRMLDELVRGEPPAEWMRRPNARDDLRERARELRGQGWSYREIAKALRVSISSCSLWLRDLPAPPPRSGEHDQERVAAMWRKRWQPILEQRGIERQQMKLAAAQEVGELSQRDLLMLGAIAYWCEGAKDKSYDRREHVSFINSDPALIQMFLRFLDAAGVEPARLRFRLHIHETADVEGATRYWADLVGVDPGAFLKPTIKRHRPKTNRRNVAEEYRGCLHLRVLDSAELYRRIEGWAFGAMLGRVRAEEPAPPAGPTRTELPRRLRLWRIPRPSGQRDARPVS